VDASTSEIGARVRTIRRRRGLSQQVVADLVGISKPYLSQLENGRRGFTRRGLLEGLAEALSCSPADLTGGALLRPDRRVLDAASAVPALTLALHDCTFDDHPDVPHRPVARLALLAARVARDADQSTYPTGSRLGELITELHVAAHGPQRQRALAALAHAGMAATYLSSAIGRDELAVTAATRAWAAAVQTGDEGLVGMMVSTRALVLARVGARRRAAALVDDALAALRTGRTPARPAERAKAQQATGMLHLTRAFLAARAGQPATCDTHLAEAADLARATGEGNVMFKHFGPANVAAWRLSTAVETERGPDAAARFTAATLATLSSRDRRAGVHLDLARAWTQDPSGAHDGDAVRHIDAADRLGPVRVRQDPLVRELITLVDRRARRRTWELESLKRRVGIA
jgi:transcriptional regulator with XRE-family HTH domain